MTDGQMKVIINKILAQDGVPWRRTFSKIGRPRNYNSKRFYHGINLLLFHVMDYPSPDFITFKKAMDENIKLEKGKSIFAVAWIPKYKKKDNESPAMFEDRKKHSKPNYFGLLFHNLWNISNTSKWDEIKDEKVEAQTIINPQTIINLTPLQFTLIESGKAKCIPNKEIPIIGMPPKAHFDSLEEYYEAFFHEMAHATKNHLNRKYKDEAGIKEGYAAEELVAEICAWLLCQESGISNDTMINNSASYIAGWKARIKNNPDVLFWAMIEAEKALNYIMGRKNAK